MTSKAVMEMLNEMGRKVINIDKFGDLVEIVTFKKEDDEWARITFKEIFENTYKFDNLTLLGSF